MVFFVFSLCCLNLDLGFGVGWISLSLFVGLFVRMFCMRQTDLKSLIAYCPVAHMSMVIGGTMTLSY
jgi:NADH:ubiquinone oxidoreductase subunit 4 (subunit M)